MALKRKSSVLFYLQKTLPTCFPKALLVGPAHTHKPNRTYSESRRKPPAPGFTCRHSARGAPGSPFPGEGLVPAPGKGSRKPGTA